MKPATCCCGGKGKRIESKLFPKSDESEALEHLVHIDEEGMRCDLARTEFEAASVEDQARQFNSTSIVLVETREGRNRRGARVLDQRHSLQSHIHGAKPLAMLGATQWHPRRTSDRCTKDPVQLNVFGEVVIPNFDRKRNPEPPPDLLVESDSAANGEEGFFLRAVPLEHSPRER